MDIEKYIDNYVDWLKSEITFTKFGEYYEITTPFLDVDGDYLQLYVKQDGHNLIFTDDSFTINKLEMAGLKMTTNRKEQMVAILNQFGICLHEKELVLKAPANEFAPKKHAFIQAMLRINDMYMTSRSKVTSFFLDDVQDFFTTNDIYCMENVQFLGKSGFSHNYDFAIQRTKNKPERLCLAINNANVTAMNNTLFAWNDTKPFRKSDSQLIVFLNDSNTISKGIEEGFSNYDVNTIRWSERNFNKNMNLLTA